MKVHLVPALIVLLLAPALSWAGSPAPAETPFYLCLVPNSSPASSGLPELPAAGCAAPAGSDQSAGHFWARTDYLLWGIKDSRLPALVSAGAPSSGAIVGRGAATLFGDGGINNAERSGARFLLGYWFDPEQSVGIEGGYFFLGARSVDFAAASSGAPGEQALGRPFLDALTGLPNSQLVSFPGLVGGSVNVNLSSRLQGFEANAVANLCCGCNWRVEVLAGFRYLQLDERLGVTENLLVNPLVPFIGGTRFGVTDQFDTRNRFYGANVGARAEFRLHRLIVTGQAKLALGDSNQLLGINGTTTTIAPGGGTTVLPGGLLALPTNIGRYRRDEFAVVPEVNLNLAYQLTQSLRATVGYSFLYCNEVSRPGDQVNLAVNPARLPVSGPVAPFGPAQPAFAFHGNDFWAQGLNLGLEFRY